MFLYAHSNWEPGPQEHPHREMINICKKQNAEIIEAIPQPIADQWMFKVNKELTNLPKWIRFVGEEK